ncbi:hypothetical protein FQN57_006465 [Myotisia sp. PD_48]|nr:hypothetical protein FQN57_006465 [Myotisia sp. PD_48]
MNLSVVLDLFSSKSSPGTSNSSFSARLRRIQERLHRYRPREADKKLRISSITDKESQRSSSEPPQLSLSPFTSTIFPVLPEEQGLNSFFDTLQISQPGGAKLDPAIDSFRPKRHGDGVQGDLEDDEDEEPLPIIVHDPVIEPLWHPPPRNSPQSTPSKSILRPSSLGCPGQPPDKCTSVDDTDANTSRNQLLSVKYPSWLEPSYSGPSHYLLNPPARYRRLSYQPPPISQTPPGWPSNNRFGPQNYRCHQRCRSERQNIFPAVPEKLPGAISRRPVRQASTTSPGKGKRAPKKSVRFDKIDLHTYHRPISQSSMASFAKSELTNFEWEAPDEGDNILKSRAGNIEAGNQIPVFNRGKYSSVFEECL